MEKVRYYHDFLIESLQKKEESALYLWAVFQEKNPEKELLPLVLQDVLEALGKTNLTSEEMAQHQTKLTEIFDKKGVDVIYNLAEWLQVLGLELTVQVKEENTEETEEIEENTEILEEVMV